MPDNRGKFPQFPKHALKHKNYLYLYLYLQYSSSILSAYCSQANLSLTLNVDEIPLL